MSDKRRKIQLELAFAEEPKGEAPKNLRPGIESLAAKRTAESPASDKQWMEEVCERENCKRALARVKANRGSPGVDARSVRDLPDT